MKNNKVSNRVTEPEEKSNFVFGKFNYILMGVGIVVLLIGYILLSGGGSDDPNVFNKAMFDSRRMVVAPVMIMMGFVIEIVAIMFSFKCKCKKAQGAQ